MAKTIFAAVLALAALAVAVFMATPPASPGSAWTKAELLLVLGGGIIVGTILAAAWIRRRRTMKRLQSLRDSALW